MLVSLTVAVHRYLLTCVYLHFRSVKLSTVSNPCVANFVAERFSLNPELESITFPLRQIDSTCLIASLRYGDSILLPDILAIIATYLEQRDLKSFRFVSRDFCAVADPLLFKSITVGHQQRVLEVFTNICNHDYIRRLVKKL